MPEMNEMEKTPAEEKPLRIQVMAPRRDGLQGIWVARRWWPSSPTVVVVSPQDLDDRPGHIGRVTYDWLLREAQLGRVIVTADPGERAAVDAGRIGALTEEVSGLRSRVAELEAQVQVQGETIATLRSGAEADARTIATARTESEKLRRQLDEAKATKPRPIQAPK